MGQNAQTEYKARGVVTVDWMVMTVAAIALLFLIGTMIRTSVEVNPSSDGGGLRSLGGDDALLVYQDFSFDAENWVPATLSDDLPGLGPVLGPFEGDAVQRSFTMPNSANTAVMTFDLQLLGEWTEGSNLRIALGEAEALTLVALGEGAAISVQADDTDMLRIRVTHATITPRSSEIALPGTDDSFINVRVQLSLTDPTESVVLRLQAEVEGDARWTLDNLSVVAITGDRAQ